jgi:hypothetical protein
MKVASETGVIYTYIKNSFYHSPNLQIHIHKFISAPEVIF